MHDEPPLLIGTLVVIGSEAIDESGHVAFDIPQQLSRCAGLPQSTRQLAYAGDCGLQRLEIGLLFVQLSAQLFTQHGSYGSRRTITRSFASSRRLADVKSITISPGGAFPNPSGS